MRFSELIEHVEVLERCGDLDAEIDAVTRDSRAVRPRSAFVAIEGAHFDGHDAVPSSVAGAIVVGRDVSGRPRVPWIRVADTRLALAQMCAALYGLPGADVDVVGVTGTNGKTTITTLLDGVLRRCGRRSAVLGTTGCAVDGQARPSALTTPEAPVLQRFIAELRDLGVPTLAMEVSSIGLVQRRVDGVPFAVGVFTNLTQDHLDFHGTMVAYTRAKARLFSDLLRPAGGAPRALLGSDDPAWDEMSAPADHWRYGFNEGADLRISAFTQQLGRARFRLETPAGSGWLETSLLGRYNAQNLTAVVGCGLLLGLELSELLGALSEASAVPGRLQPVPNERGLHVFVDYAHTPDALYAVLQAVRGAVSGEVWVVFGCGGDRDRSKRALMGRASEVADRVVVTSDNPRGEAPQQIIDDILSGMSSPPAYVEPDRARCIRWALLNARAGDGVVIAGKGHETTQEIAGVRHALDDRKVAAAVLGDE